MTEDPHRSEATSALAARAALGAQGRWNGDLAALDAALAAVDETDPLVITVDGVRSVRIVVVGTRAIATAALTPDGVRAARYVRGD